MCDDIAIPVTRQMRPRSFLRLRTVAASIILLAGLRGEPAASVLPSAETFFEPVSLAAPMLSPDGTKVCALKRFDDMHYAVIMIELPSKNAHYVVRTPDLSVVNFWWKNDDLIMMLVQNDIGIRAFHSMDLRTGKINELAGLKSYRELELVNMLPDDPDQMLFRSTSVNTTDHDILRVNLRTGEEKRIEDDPGGVLRWLTNHAGEAIAAWGQKDNKWFLLWRSDPKAEWQRKEEQVGKLPEVIPFALASDQHRLLVQDNRRTSIARISLYDPATGAYEEVCAPGEVEPDNIQLWGSTLEPGAISYETDQTHLHFLNAEAENVHQWMDKALPGTERAYSNFARDNSRAIIFAHNNRNPGVYCSLNFATRKLTVVGAAYPAINPAIMAPSRRFSFAASDGLNITGRITLPSGVEKPPLILIVGPNLDGPRSRVAFDPVAQFFASRGYATARIDHRGTEGFGRDFIAAGDFQAATGMVRDLAEGVKWLGDQGWIDSKRMAVLADRWGGLIAFPLAAKPGLFRALINFGTPMDFTNVPITAFATSGRSEKDLIAAIGGSKVADSYPESIDPLAAIGQLTIPSFHLYYMVHNREFNNDVPQNGVSKLESLLKKRGLVYELPYAPSAEQMKKSGLVYWKEQAKYFEAVVAFLQKHL